MAARSKLEKPLKVPRPDVSLSAFSFIFSELVQYSQARVSHAAELETRLANAGAAVGGRVLELVEFRDRAGKRETRIVAILQFVAGALWKALFGKNATLERSTEHEDECTSDAASRGMCVCSLGLWWWQPEIRGKSTGSTALPGR